MKLILNNLGNKLQTELETNPISIFYCLKNNIVLRVVGEINLKNIFNEVAKTNFLRIIF